MALTKTVEVDQIEVLKNGVLQVRTATSVYEDGTRLSYSFHRHCVAPGEDYSAQDSRVAAICAVVHTPAVIAAYAGA